MVNYNWNVLWHVHKINDVIDLFIMIFAKMPKISVLHVLHCNFWLLCHQNSLCRSIFAISGDYHIMMTPNQISWLITISLIIFIHLDYFNLKNIYFKIAFISTMKRIIIRNDRTVKCYEFFFRLERHKT